MVTFPELGPLGVSLPLGEDYNLRVREFSWPLNTMASKLADIWALNAGTSFREDLTVAKSPELLITVTDSGPGLGAEGGGHGIGLDLSRSILARRQGRLELHNAPL